MLGKITRDLSQIFKNFEGRSFNCEYKYDGQRAQIHMDTNGKVTIFSRNLEVSSLKHIEIFFIICLEYFRLKKNNLIEYD
jgi:DNA ligase-1